MARLWNKKSLHINTELLSELCFKWSNFFIKRQLQTSTKKMPLRKKSLMAF